jgi:hypothetical protein
VLAAFSVGGYYKIVNYAVCQVNYVSSCSCGHVLHVFSLRYIALLFRYCAPPQLASRGTFIKREEAPRSRHTGRSVFVRDSHPPDETESHCQVK